MNHFHLKHPTGPRVGKHRGEEVSRSKKIRGVAFISAGALTLGALTVGAAIAGVNNTPVAKAKAAGGLTTSCSYAADNGEKYANNLCWIDDTGLTPDTNAVTVNMPDGATATFTYSFVPYYSDVSNISSGPFTGLNYVTSPTYSIYGQPSALGVTNYYGVAGKPWWSAASIIDGSTTTSPLEVDISNGNYIFNTFLVVS